MWHTLLSDKEVVDIDDEHTFLEAVDKPLLIIVHGSSYYLQIDGVVISGSILPIFIASQELCILKIVIPLCAT